MASVAAAAFPLSRTLRFRDTNLDAVSLVNAPADFDGALVDFQGRVLGMWASFAYQTGRDLTQVNMGIQADVIVDMLDSMRRGESLRSIEVEWAQMPLATARKVDLPDAWVARYEAHNPEKREVLAVSTSVARLACRGFLPARATCCSASTDKLANTFREVERAVQQPTVEVHGAA